MDKMMKLFITILTGTLLFGNINTVDYSDSQNISSLAVVTLVGGKILSGQNEIKEKYKREDCPVCKGKGWYISGDGIKKIECQYCEP